jgi:hypothetical protein
MKRRISLLWGVVVFFIASIITPPDDLAAQTESGQYLVQYLFPSFSRSTIIIKSGKMMNLMLNYNTVSEKLVFEQNGQYFDLANPEATVTATIEKREFIPYETYFLEVVINDEISFYVRHKGELVVPGRPMGYGTTSQLTSSNYLSGVQTPSGYYNFKLPEGYTVRQTPLYYLRVGGDMHSFMGEKQFLRIFPDESDKLKQFIRKNRIKLDKTEDLIRLVNYCNELN